VSELLALSLTELIARLGRREASPVELMQASLDRIDATHADWNAFVALEDRDRLLEQAREAEARIGRGEARALEGVPLGVKDLEDAAGLPNTEGSLLFRDRISQADTVQVERLRAAGAIVIGKTNTPEFGYTAITKNLLHGVTRSPWDPERTPGGSSGGSAAAICGLLCPLVTASDGGGSIRIPASFTGCFGLKPSFGRVPRGPASIWETDDTSVAGPLTKTVEDAALQLDVTCGASPWDPNSLPHPGISYLAALAQELPAGTRFGFSPDLGDAVVQSDVAATVEEAARVFEALGHRLVPVSGGPPRMAREWSQVSGFERAARLAEFLPQREDELPHFLARGLRAVSEISAAEWRGIQEKRALLNRWCAELFAQVDLLLTPTVPYDPPPAKGPFPEETEGRRQPGASVAAFTIPFNLGWQPAATVRAGLSHRGLPVGLQIVGPRHREDLVLQAARAFERERPWHPHWPPLG
jgi:aspartyl-tRNA(Asn)/glutamyl-tRNA(Gln) amidotransferase subunit A